MPSKTSVIRVPAAVVRDAQQIGAVLDCSAGDMLARAWREYAERRRPEIADQLDATARWVREGAQGPFPQPPAGLTSPEL